MSNGRPNDTVRKQRGTTPATMPAWAGAQGLPRIVPGAVPPERLVSPLLPVLLPLVIAAIITGVLFAWWFPPAAPGAVVPAARFTDITAEAGLEGFGSNSSEADSPTTLSGGVVCLDFDGDGNEDLFFVHGGPWPWEEPLAKRISRGSCALFRNDGAGHFTDVTAMAGLNVELQGMSAVAGDFDNDGRPDLFIACVGTNHLFRNRGNGRFEDITESAGVGGEDNSWSTSAVWIDYDNDGRLDLVVGHYARWPDDVDLRTAFMVAAIGRSYGTPTGFVGAAPSVYRNLGDGRFAVVADSAGLRAVDPQTGFPIARTLAVVPVDANDDGQLDLLFTYLDTESVLFINQRNGTFRRWQGGADLRQDGLASGLAAASSLPFAQIGGADERFAAIQAVVSADTRANGGAAVRLAPKLGVAFLDYDLDGRLDFFSGEGRAEAGTNRFEEVREFQAAPELRWNRGVDWIKAQPATETGTWIQPLTARGVATADFDGDGDLDVIMAQNGGTPRLLRNDQRLGWPWLKIDLVATRSSREAGGARVEVHTPRRVLMQSAMPAISFMAQSASTLTFGLGDDARVRKIVVHWPSGTRQEVRIEGVNRRLQIVER